MKIEPDSYFKSLISDEKIGSGTARDVYAVKERNDVVIKVQTIPFPHSNMVEWIVWGALERMGEEILGNETNQDLKNIFAECFKISETGKYLLMERLEQSEPFDKETLIHCPSWFNDRKPSAFGKSNNGTTKILDYGMIDFYEVLNPKNRKNLFI